MVDPIDQTFIVNLKIGKSQVFSQLQFSCYISLPVGNRYHWALVINSKIIYWARKSFRSWASKKKVGQSNSDWQSIAHQSCNAKLPEYVHKTAISQEDESLLAKTLFASMNNSPQFLLQGWWLIPTVKSPNWRWIWRGWLWEHFNFF